jgi:hypothetical protein
MLSRGERGALVATLLLAGLFGCGERLQPPTRYFSWAGEGTDVESLIVLGDFDGKTSRRFNCYRKPRLCVEAVGYVRDGLLNLDTEVFFLETWRDGIVTSDDGRLEIDLRGKRLRLDGQLLRSAY